jgi:hypothetical protein
MSDRFASRHESIQEIASRQKSSKSFGDFYSCFYHPSGIKKDDSSSQLDHMVQFPEYSGLDDMDSGLLTDEDDESTRANTDSGFMSKHPSMDSLVMTSEEDTDEDVSVISHTSASVPKIKIPGAIEHLSPKPSKTFKQLIAPTPPNTPTNSPIYHYIQDQK